MTEKTLERRLTREVEKRGGLCVKIISPGTRGMPDRVVLAPDGRVFFVELKTITGRLSERQRHMIAELRKRNAAARVLKGPDDIDYFLLEVFGAGYGAERGASRSEV